MKKTILVVEDDFIVALDIKTILEANDYNVIADIDNVADAIKAIALHQPQLVLIDMQLRGNKDGIDLGHVLLQNDDIPYLYITANADNDSIEKAKATRPYGYIIKPFRPADLIANVAIVINNFRYKKIDTKRHSCTEQQTTFRIKEVIKYIDAHLTEKIDLNQLVGLTTWEKHHFIATFKQQIGTTPYQYILERKIDHSKGLIKQSDLSIMTIAFELGFKSYSNFCNAFKKTTSLTPEQYKNQIFVK